MSPSPPAALPVILLPVGVDDDALDACLGALDAGTPAGTRIWLADDAQAGPRASAIIERWLERTPLQADYTRRPRMIGEVAHLDEMLNACAGVDVVVLASDAQPLPGWLQQLAACFSRDAAIATATPWCNAGESAAWPRLGEIVPPPTDFERTAAACAAMPPLHPELPAAVAHAVALRGSARQRVGGLDASSYASWYAALIDLSLRLSGLGWRNALCETAFVARGGEGAPSDGDMDTLNARWPAWNARLANFLMEDPLREPRERLTALHATAGTPEPQRELFP
ncbi:MAG TPA: glycosyltransferase [Pseudoxanthomonas sp.]